MRSMTSRFWIERRVGQTLDWLYPDGQKTCVICHHVLPSETILARIRRLDKNASEGKMVLWDLVCPLCLQDFTRLRPESLGRNLVVSSRSPGARKVPVTIPVHSRYNYEGLVQRLIRPWKYDGALGIGIWFAEELAKGKTIEQWRAVDAIVPVPTSKARLQMRGYHHTLLLARQLSKQLSDSSGQLSRRPPEGQSGQLSAGTSSHRFSGTLPRQPAVKLRVPVWQGLLRTGGVETQTAKSAEQRQRVIKSEMVVPNPEECRGRRLLLLDDVVTTGSTLHGCAEKLLEAGAASVECLVIAYVK